MILRFLLLLMLATPAIAQPRQPSHCRALAQDAGAAYITRANLPEGAADSVYLHYIDHAAFLIRTENHNIITDYTGFVGAIDWVPDVVTMNHAHESHWTWNPDPAIAHVLPGWGEFGVGITHNLDLGDVLIRNVSTDIRSQYSGIEPRGNSIFVFEAAGLCIGHLGHLHHEPDDAQYAALGRLDVVMAPVDGGTTMALPAMIRVLGRLRSSVIIPMHWFSQSGLDVFLDGVAGDFDIVDTGGPGLVVSLDRLPKRPTVMVLWPEWLRK